MPIQRQDIRSEETVSMNPMPLTKKKPTCDGNKKEKIFRTMATPSGRWLFLKSHSVVRRHIVWNYITSRLIVSSLHIFIIPDAVEDVSIGKDANVDVGYDDVVEMSFSLVGEEEIGHPDLVGICQCQVL
jgi:hypothetical protein